MRERVDRFVFLSGFLFCGARVAFSLFMSRETVNSSPYPGSISKSAQSTPSPARPRAATGAHGHGPPAAVIASEGQRVGSKRAQAATNAEARWGAM